MKLIFVKAKKNECFFVFYILEWKIGAHVWGCLLGYNIACYRAISLDTLSSHMRTMSQHNTMTKNENM